MKNLTNKEIINDNSTFQRLTPILNTESNNQPITPNIQTNIQLNIVIASMAVGGAERCVLDTILGLKNSHFTINLFIVNDIMPSYEIDTQDNLKIHHLSKLSSSKRFKTIALEVLCSPTKVIYTHLIRVKDLEKLWIYGITTIPVIHNSELGWHDSPQTLNSQNIPFLIAVSESVENQLKNAGYNKPIIVIRHELQRFIKPENLLKYRESIRAKHGIRNDTLLIGMVGQFKAHKAYTRAVRVLHYLLRHHKIGKVKLIILGGWDHSYGSGRLTYTATCKRALDLGVMPDVIMPGSIQNVTPYYPAFDVFLNTSIYEGLSIASLEAIQCGCPVVSANVGGQGEVLDKNNCIIVNDPSNIKEYAESILKLAFKSKERHVPLHPLKPNLVPFIWCFIAHYGSSQRINYLRLSQPSEVDTLFLTSNINPGGAQRSLINLLSALPASGHKAFLCIMDTVLTEYFFSLLETFSLPVISLRHIKEKLNKVDKILELINSLGVKNICFWNLDPQIKLLITKIHQTTNLRIIDVSPGPMLFQELTQENEFQQRICFTMKQYLQRLNFFVSKYNGGLPSQEFDIDSEKLIVIPNGISIPEKLNLLTGSDAFLSSTINSNYAIVTCCRIVPNKRIEYLIDMMSILSNRIPEASLTIVGGVDPRHITYWNNIRTKIESLGLKNIYFAGQNGDVFSFLANYKAFVMISYAQGCPNASLEAMAAGLPIVANDDGGTREQIINGVNGFLVSDNNPNEMADKVELLLRKPSIAKSLGSAGREIARSKFTLDKMVDSYLKLFTI